MSGIPAIVVTKLELANVQRKILAAHLMELTNDPALDDGPEPFNGVHMNRAADIFAYSVVNRVAC